MKLLPQYSVRLMFAVMTLAAGLFSVVGLAMRGHTWAIGVSVGLGSLLLLLACGAALFGLLWIFSLVSSPWAARGGIQRRSGRRSAGSPFATAPIGGPFAEPPVDAIVIDTAPPHEIPSKPRQNDAGGGGAD